MEDFNLSEKRIKWFKDESTVVYKHEDIKTFIKKLKDILCKEMIERGRETDGLDRISQRFIWDVIEGIAGDKLI